MFFLYVLIVVAAFGAGVYVGFKNDAWIAQTLADFKNAAAGKR